jgi:signal peptidase I
LNLESDTLLRARAKRSSSETLIERSAPDTCRIDDAKLFPELISDLLTNGHRVRFRAPGYSMYPTILHQDVITVEPVDAFAVKVGDIILYRVQQSLIAHRVVKILKRSEKNSHSAPQGPQDRSGSPFGARPSTSETLSFILRGDARPFSDEPINAEQILGKVVSVERDNRGINPYSLKVKLTFYSLRLASRLKRFLSQRPPA